jgi:hypothetical protein
MEQEQPFSFKTHHKSQVIKELDRFIAEWRAWEKEVDKLGGDPENPFDPRPGRMCNAGPLKLPYSYV